MSTLKIDFHPLMVPCRGMDVYPENRFSSSDGAVPRHGCLISNDPGRGGNARGQGGGAGPAPLLGAFCPGAALRRAGRDGLAERAAAGRRFKPHPYVLLIWNIRDMQRKNSCGVLLEASGNPDAMNAGETGGME